MLYRMSLDLLTRRRIEQLVVRLFPIGKGACASERREILKLRKWKEEKIKAEVAVQGADVLKKYT